MRSGLVIVSDRVGVNLAKAVSVNIKVTHIFACHVPSSDIDRLVAHFTPDVDAFKEVGARAAQLRRREELQGVFKSALFDFRSIIVNARRYAYLRWQKWQATFVVVLFRVQFLGHAALCRIQCINHFLGDLEGLGSFQCIG